MGRVLIKAEFVEVDSLVRKWAQIRNLTIAHEATPTHCNQADNASEFVEVTGKGAFYVAKWQCGVKDDCYEVSLNLKPRIYLNVILHLMLFAGLCYAVFVMRNIVQEYTNTKLLQFSVSAILVILLLWWKDRKLSARLVRLENSFWQLAEGHYDTLQLTRAEGSVYSRKSRLLTELLLTGALVWIGIIALGWLGAIVTSLLCLPFMVMIVAETLRSNDPQWHWHFWIIGNMARWTILMLAVLAIATVLSALDIIQNLELYKERPDNLSFTQAIRHGSFRDISPATAELLESDVKARLQNMADKEVSELKNKTPLERLRWRRIIFYFNGLFVFLVAAVTVCLFSVIPLRSIFKSRERWCDEVGKSEGPQGPAVPYLPKAWKRQVPRMLRGLIFFHYLFGGLINLAAVVFCMDGLSYLFIGRTILIERSANLWSWILATSEIVMGERFGRVAGAVLVLAINIPLLLILATYAKRFLCSVVLAIRVSILGIKGSATLNEEFSLIDEYIKEECSRFNINRPILFFTKEADALVRLKWLSLSGKPVIEITKGAFELLNPDEMRAVIAHELGHVKQGLWKIWILKVLSSAALFPNHYLTLCLDWSKKEVQADEFALEVTGDPKSLKTALVKMSSAQGSVFSPSPGNTTTSNRFAAGVQRRWRDMLISIQFFMGDGLLGYVHPYLSERLENIEVKAETTG